MPVDMYNGHRTVVVAVVFSDVKSGFFRNPDICWCNPDIRFSSTQLCDRSTPPLPTIWSGECKHRRRMDIRRGTNWPFPLSPPSASNLAQFDLRQHTFACD